MNPAAPADVIIFKNMSPEESQKHLLNKKANGMSWMLRESQQPGMLTVSFCVFSNYAPIYQGNTRFAFTGKQWVVTSNLEKVKTIPFVDVDSNDTARCKQLCALIKTASFVVELNETVLKFPFKSKDQLLPSPGMETTNKCYSNYILSIT